MDIRDILNNASVTTTRTDALIGMGTYSYVYNSNRLVQCIPSYAIKISNSSDHKTHLLNELVCLHFCKHPNIIRALCALDSGEFLIMTDLYKSDLTKFRVTTDILPTLALHLISAVNYLHNRGIIHRDIKPNNILVTTEPEFRAVLCDFGFSVLMATCTARSQTYMSNCIQSGVFRAPEVAFYDPSGKYDFSVDIWSVGILLLEQCKNDHFSIENMCRFAINNLYKLNPKLFDKTPTSTNFVSTLDSTSKIIDSLLDDSILIMCAILMPYRLTDSNITSYTKLNTRDIYSQYAQLTSDIIRKHLATIITRGYNLLDIIASCLLPSCYLPSFNKYKQGRRITSSNITNITNQQTRATSLDCLIAISKIINPVNPLTVVTFIPRIGAYGACDSNAAILTLIPLIQQPSQNTINIACEIADSVCVDDNCNSCDIKIAILASAAILCDDIKTFNAINTHYANELKTGTPKLVKLL